MDSAKNQLTDRLKSANNVLVTVSRGPSVDQLAALLGLTLLLDKMGKHAAAVYSGETPSTIEFLQPEEVIEKNPDSLRDFIIALDKAKADKLRYKVEDDIVRIFITPYKTSISQDDFDFSQGDFNVDVVVALGVHQQEDLDTAITAHGRILHDAAVATLNVGVNGELGSINWYDPQASSLSELVTELAQALGADLLDRQIATALLTGVVAETERFSNAKTSSQTMSVAAALMAAGADQQLVATKLEEGGAPPEAAAGAAPGTPPSGSGGGASAADTAIDPNDGTIAIDHASDASDTAADLSSMELPAPQLTDTPPPAADAPGGQLATAADDAADTPLDIGGSGEASPAPPAGMPAGPKLITEPPSLGGTLTANVAPEGLDPSTDPMSAAPAPEPPTVATPEPPVAGPASESKPESEPPAADAPADDLPAAPAPEPPLTLPSELSGPAGPAELQPPPPAPAPPTPVPAGGTLSELEEAVHSPHMGTAPPAPAPPAESLDAVRDEVDKAFQGQGSDTPKPIVALNAQPLGDELHASMPPPEPSAPAPTVSDPAAPPPVPPPLPFQFGGNDNPPAGQ